MAAPATAVQFVLDQGEIVIWTDRPGACECGRFTHLFVNRLGRTVCTACDTQREQDDMPLTSLLTKTEQIREAERQAEIYSVAGDALASFQCACGLRKAKCHLLCQRSLHQLPEELVQELDSDGDQHVFVAAYHNALELLAELHAAKGCAL